MRLGLYSWLLYIFIFYFCLFDGLDKIVGDFHLVVDCQFGEGLHVWCLGKAVLLEGWLLWLGARDLASVVVVLCEKDWFLDEVVPLLKLLYVANAAMNIFELFLTWIAYKLQHPSIMFFILWFTNAIFFKWIWSAIFRFLDTKVKIFEFDLLFLPEIQNRFFYINFALLFQILLLLISLFSRCLCWYCFFKNFNTFSIISDLVFFLKILKVFYKLFRWL